MTIVIFLVLLAAACQSALSASRKGSSRHMRAKWGRALRRSWWLFGLRDMAISGWLRPHAPPPGSVSGESY